MMWLWVALSWCVLTLLSGAAWILMALAGRINREQEHHEENYPNPIGTVHRIDTYRREHDSRGDGSDGSTS
jgi:hypothetical protein